MFGRTVPLVFIAATACVLSACVNSVQELTSDAIIPVPTQFMLDPATIINDHGYPEFIVEDLEFVEIPAGNFLMGSDHGESKELPIHEVFLDRYWMSKYPVTVAQFAKFVTATKYVTDSSKGEGCWIETDGSIRYDVNWRQPGFIQEQNHPAICISWNDAMAYSNWFSTENNLQASLPTEAQWEKAARGTDQRIWPWGNEHPNGSQANFADRKYLLKYGHKRRNADQSIDDGFAQTSPVDAFPDGRSPYGLYDMAGNTIDWLYDWFDGSYYARSPANNPIGPYRNPIRKKHLISGGWGDNLQRSIRGGAWTDASGVLSLAEGGHSIRADMRERTDQYSSDDHLGFRLVIDNVSRYPSYQPPAQMLIPVATARAAVMESVGDAQITVEYDRLAVNGREGRIFGESVAFGQTWSPGDKISTQIDTTHALEINSSTLPAGTYNLFLVPEDLPAGSGEWTVIFCKTNSGQQGVYRVEDEVLRIKTRAQIEDNSKNRMEYFFDTADDGGRILRFLYEFVEVHIPFEQENMKVDEVSRAFVMNAINDTEIRLSYFRDVAAGTPVFGEQIPPNKQWMGSVNEPATIRFSDWVQIGEQQIAAGQYELSFIPRLNSSWGFTLTRRTNDEKTSVIAYQQFIEVDIAESGPKRLEYYFDYISGSERALVMAWAGATVSISIKVKPEKRLPEEQRAKQSEHIIE